MRSPRRLMAATTLCCEALAVLFAGLVARSLSSLSTGAALGIAAALAAGCVLSAGLLRRRGGYAGGSLMQVLLIGYGWWVPAMYVVGGLFALLWVASLVIGTRLERETRLRAGTPPAA